MGVTFICELCSNLEIHVYIRARALKHIFDSDRFKLLKTSDFNNTEYIYFLEKLSTTNECFKQI